MGWRASPNCNRPWRALPTDPPRLVPELDVSDLQRSLTFYEQVLGFNRLYDRPEEGFAYLDFHGAHLMLEQAEGPGRRFHSAPLVPPFGRGMNLQIEAACAALQAVHQRLLENGFNFVIPLEERWYRRDGCEVGQRQFVVADPDGYLLRFCCRLG
jgi:catechol 2,3-dioxygenase-like lactoylglutathione lyase family enzyme